MYEVCRNPTSLNRIRSDEITLDIFLNKLHDIFEIEPHYDVHMNNILVDFKDDRCVFKIIDFDFIDGHIHQYDEWIRQYQNIITQGPQVHDEIVRSHRENLQCLLWIFLQGNDPIDTWYSQYPPELNIFKYWACKSTTLYDFPPSPIFETIYPKYEDRLSILNNCIPILDPFCKAGKIVTPKIIDDIIIALDACSVKFPNNDFSKSVAGYGVCAGLLLCVFNYETESRVKNRCLQCIQANLHDREFLK